MTVNVALQALGGDVVQSVRLGEQATSVYAQQMRGWEEIASRHAWSHFVTLTFSRPADQARAERSFSRFVRRLEWHSRCRIEYLGALERGLLGRLHIHALVAGTNEQSIDLMTAQWGQGRVAIKVFDPARNALYALKTLPDAESLLLIRAPKKRYRS
jgi:hypothetical protein